VTWVDGKIGGAAKFDGKGAHIQLPNTDALDRAQEGSFTVAAWFKPEDVPPGKESDNNESYGIIMKGGWHTGLQYNSEQKFVMTHWLAGAAEPEWKGIGTWDDTYAPGQWYHVAGTVDRAAGKVAIYVNGEPKGEVDFPANSKSRDYEKMPWRIGVGMPGAEKWGWPAKGSIDDVRIYGTALTPDEVKGIFDGGAKK
ncbi:MAG TPA: LamG domain-containing protein, partial [Planctomycetota bacterium]|nr:LamG domain-containing protein [Planctomycetota bacterium]